MLDKQIEQPVNIKFPVKLKKPATETLKLLSEAYGEENSLLNARVFEWQERFYEEENMSKMTRGLAVR
jgi:hypothetical protein